MEAHATSDENQPSLGADSPDSAQSRLEALDRQHLWHAFTPMATYSPFVIERGEGFELIDIHGRRYLDAESSLWCNVHGHRHPRIDAAIREQLDRIAHVTLLGMACDTTVRLAAALVDRSPPGLDHVFLSSDGASAVEVALKLALEHHRRVDSRTRRDRFLCFDAAYHGDTLGTLSVGGLDRFNRVFAPLLFDVIRADVPDSYRLPSQVSPDAAADWYLQRIAQVFIEHGHRLAAVVIEPLVQCAAGIVVHPTGFLAGLSRLCREQGVLLIADEIAVGCGRTGTWTACEAEGVVPDLLCLGKGLTGGYLPLSATLTSKPIWDSFLGTTDQPGVFCHGHTYGGNPLACAAALASLELFDEQDLTSNVRARSAELLRRLAPLSLHPHVGDVRGRGLALAIELVEDRALRKSFEPARQIGRQVCDVATRNGVWLRPLQDVIAIVPPLAIGSTEVERIADVVMRAIAEVLG